MDIQLKTGSQGGSRDTIGAAKELDAAQKVAGCCAWEVFDPSDRGRQVSQEVWEPSKSPLSWHNSLI